MIAGRLTGGRCRPTGPFAAAGTRKRVLSLPPRRPSSGDAAVAAAMIDVRTLHDGGQRAEDVAGWIADFVAKAERTLDLAHYDFHLKPDTGSIVGGAIREAGARGVGGRFVYNVDHRNPIPVPPPPEPDAQLIA